MKTLEEISKIREEKRKELDLRVNLKANTKEKHILVCKGTGCSSSKSPKIIETFRKILEEKKYYSITGEEPLFVGKKHKRLHRSQVYRFINDVCGKLNISVNVGTHTMRKTFGYHHYKLNNDVALLQKIFNHSSPSITMRYIGIAQEELDESYINFEL